ncbi:MAG: hypothetical protein K5647_04810 [Clostridiales bacterium]|nr:hypothetical protein [Clostridiales bacterium]
MIKTAEEIAGKLKEIIEKNGTGYLADEPYRVYTELIKTGSADRKTAGAILCFLVSNLGGKTEWSCDAADLFRAVQKECGFNKKLADRLVEIVLCLYSPSNRQKWDKKDGEGLRTFLDEVFSYTWNGFAVWDEGNGTIDCSYEANIVLKPTDEVSENRELVLLLKKNPFARKEEIHNLFEKKLQMYLDNDFKEYCTCDDYYPPVAEDYEIGYSVSEWSEKYGFEVISCDGDGGEGDYEPKFRRKW